jgi:hypothetical protein
MSRRAKLGLVVIVALLVLVGFLCCELFEERWKTRVWPEDEPFVRMAYDMEAAPGKGQDFRQKGVFYPRVIRFPDEVCVQLNSNFGWTDGGSIYCFRSTDRKATRSFPVIS